MAESNYANTMGARGALIQGVNQYQGQTGLLELKRAFMGAGYSEADATRLAIDAQRKGVSSNFVAEAMVASPDRRPSSSPLPPGPPPGSTPAIPLWDEFINWLTGTKRREMPDDPDLYPTRTRPFPSRPPE